MATATERATDVAFLDYLEEWLAGRPRLRWKDVVAQAGGPDRVAVLVIDMIRGFCEIGPLSSPRVGRLAGPVAEHVGAAHAHGVERIVAFCDRHQREAREFGSYPPHCLQGTAEAEVIDDLARLPFWSREREIDKNSLSAFLAGDHVVDMVRAGVRCFVIVGDCTDLCVYNAALPLRLYGNQHELDLRVIVPAEAVDTYDLPLEQARAAGAPPHPGDLFHRVFLYSMACNGVEVVKRIE